MNVTQFSFHDLPFHKLFQDYISNPKKLDAFFGTHPFDDGKIEETIKSYSFQNDRGKTTELLKNYNRRFGAGKTTLQSVERLADENALAIVTGQQLVLYGGPLFTVYKIITAIHIARKWEQQYNVPCIPVFWLADEDHDYKEVAEFGFPLNDAHQKISLNHNLEKESRVAEIPLSGNFTEFKNKVVENQFDTDFTDQLWRKIDKCYKPGATIGEAFGKFILELFEEHGVVLAGTAEPSIKEFVSPAMMKSVRQVDEQYKSLKSTTDELVSGGYHAQVHLQHSNLFWIDDETRRVKLSYQDDGIWSVDQAGKSWTSDELTKAISDAPERFSPNVFLRPILQNELLPGFAYIAGPGEIAYYAQMKEFYADFDQTMPVIIPRFSATLMESGIDRIFEKLPFEFSAYNKRIEDLESEFIELADTPDIEKIFEEWKEGVTGISQKNIEMIKEIDPTLEGSSEKAKSAFFTELDKLKGKVYRSVKDQEKTQLKRIRKIMNNLFPEGNLQEREVAFIYFMNKYGLDIWDNLLEELKDEVPNTHKIIHL